jgi:hypothetical protein
MDGGTIVQAPRKRITHGFWAWGATGPLPNLNSKAHCTSRTPLRRENIMERLPTRAPYASSVKSQNMSGLLVYFTCSVFMVGLQLITAVPQVAVTHTLAGILIAHRNWTDCEVVLKMWL